MNGLNWFYIGIQVGIPPLAALLLAALLWRRNQIILGNIAGTAVIFATAMGLILREYVELDRWSQACLDAGSVCWPEPPAFTRFAIYAFIALIEVFVLFTASLRFEERRRRSSYAREWQR